MSNKPLVIIFLIVFLLWPLSGVMDALILLIRIRKYEGQVMATIIFMKERSYYGRYGRVYSYCPTYQYTVDGIIYESQSPLWYRDKRFSIGDKILLHYDLKNPVKYVAGEKKFWIDNLIRHVMVALSLPFIYLICFLLSLIL